MAKRRSTEGKKGKHGRDETGYTEGLVAQRRRNMLIITIVAIVIIAVILLVVTYFFLLTPEEEEQQPVLAAAQLTGGGDPNETIGFAFTINNPKNKEDIYSILISGLPNDWAVDLPTTISMDKKESVKTDFTVIPSLETALNQSYPFTLTITSGNTQQSYSLDYTLTVFHGTFGVELFCYNNTHDADPGRSTSYALLIKNTGNGEDTMTLSYTESQLPANWSITFEFDTISIPIQEYRIVICTINTYENTSKGRYDIMVKASAGNGLSAETWLNTSLVLNFTSTVVAIGDLLQVDYIGMYAEGEIFDTSVFDAANNSDLPKSSEFQMRPSYEPLKMFVGTEESPDPDYTSVILGFWEGTVGLKVNETTVTRFPSEKGYGDGKWRLFEIKVISID
jgi:hypothetical protein